MSNIRRTATITDTLYDDPWGFLESQQVNVSGGNVTVGNLVMTGMTPSWVPNEHERRRTAYIVLASYDNNKAERLLSQTMQRYGGADLPKLMEDGLYPTLVNRITAAILGDDIAYTTPEQPEEAEAPEDSAENVKAWASKESFRAVLKSSIRTGVALGDCKVAVVYFDEKRKRPRLRLYEPDSFFPEMKNGDLQRVIFAWEEIDPDAGDDTGLTHRVRREIYELRDDGFCWYSKGYYRFPKGSGNVISLEGFTLIEGTSLTPEETVGKTTEQDEDGTVWAKTEYQFIPVVYIPLDPWGEDRLFGKAPFAHMLQLIDDYIKVVTNMSLNMDTAGKVLYEDSEGTEPFHADIPQEGEDNEGESDPNNERRITQSGHDVVSLYNGMIYQGRLRVLDTSMANASCEKHKADLDRRIGLMSGLVTAFLTPESGQIPSGIALQILLNPFLSMINDYREVITEKLARLLKYVQEIGRIHGSPDFAGEPVEVTVKFGNILPVDRDAEANRVSALYRDGLIDLETAIKLLNEAGVLRVKDPAKLAESIKAEKEAMAPAAVPGGNIVSELNPPMPGQMEPGGLEAEPGGQE